MTSHADADPNNDDDDVWSWTHYKLRMLEVLEKDGQIKELKNEVAALKQLAGLRKQSERLKDAQIAALKERVLQLEQEAERGGLQKDVGHKLT